MARRESAGNPPILERRAGEDARNATYPWNRRRKDHPLIGSTPGPFCANVGHPRNLKFDAKAGTARAS